MLEIRLVEERIQSLYNEGHIRGSTHLSNGQEAVAVGVAAATRPTDTFTCTYRGHAAALALGLTPTEVIGEICGRIVGCNRGVGGSMHLCGPDVGLLPTFAIVGAGMPIAVGAALTAQSLGTDSIGVAMFGDGSTNIGAFHESLNLASIWQLPVVFVIENNLYGEYSRINLTTPIVDLASRADAYAMPSEVVDGQDVEEVAASMSRAVLRARSGEGPTLLEMKTYRYSGHSRSDPASYRPKEELDAWLARDPISIMANRLIGDGIASHESLTSIREAVGASVEAAVEEVLESPFPLENEMFEHVSVRESTGW
jgi:TPP-dependent pyruvate/acetoin dehydrogenase alpha subunit